MNNIYFQQFYVYLNDEKKCEISIMSKTIPFGTRHRIYGRLIPVNNK